MFNKSRQLAKNLMEDIKLSGLKVIPLKIANCASVGIKVYRGFGRLFRWIQRQYISNFRYCPKLLSYILPRPQGVRRYISPDLGIEETFIALNKLGVRYVILRWFHELPEWPQDEDIDILVHDEDLHKLDSLFVWYSSKTPVDIYTISATLGWNDMPYYPPQKSRELLARREKFRSHYYIPCKEHRFYSLAYHIVLRKGAKAGLQLTVSSQNSVISDHDYVYFLEQDRPKNLTNEFSLDNLWLALEQNEWLPKLDTLGKLSTYNKWITTKLASTEYKAECGELMLFVVREAAHEMNTYQLIIDWFEQHHFAFTPLLTHRLTEAEKERATRVIRGGEWGKGCYQKSGGKPDTFIVIYDYSPNLPSLSEIRNNPWLSNTKYNAKHDLRETINRNQFFTKRCNLIHSPDNQRETLEYLEEVLEHDSLSLVHNSFKTHYNRCAGNYPVLEKKSTYGTRAKVETILYKNKRAIKKTFKVGQEEYLARELFAYKILSQHTKLIASLLDYTNGYLVIEELTTTNDKPAIETFSREVIAFLKLLFDKGYFFTDLHEGNILNIESNQIRLIDFEFLQKYKSKPQNFNQSYDLIGVPLDQGYDLPKGYPHGVLAFRKKLLSINNSII